MNINYSQNNNIVTVNLYGELDESNSEFVRSTLDNLSMDNNFKMMLIDFQHVEFVDSTGIGVLIGRYKKLSAKNKTLAVKNLNKQVEKVFKLSGLFQIIEKFN